MVKAYRAALDAGKQHATTRCSPTTRASTRSTGRRSSARSGPTPPTPRCPLAELQAPGRADHRRCRRTSRSHPLVEKVLADRAAMGRGEIRVDWGMGEHLAFASLVASGYAVRLSGEDSAAAPSPTATPCCTTRTASAGTRAPTCRCSTWPRTRRRSSSSTRCCPKRRCSASSTATPAPSRTRWSSGKRSSAISPTARRS